jgi:hypothetical protein
MDEATKIAEKRMKGKKFSSKKKFDLSTSAENYNNRVMGKKPEVKKTSKKIKKTKTLKKHKK